MNCGGGKAVGWCVLGSFKVGWTVECKKSGHTETEEYKKITTETGGLC